MLIRNVDYISSLAIFVTLIVVYVESHIKERGIIYILLWTPMYHEPFTFWKRKRKSFVAMNCEFQNCFIVNNGDYFEDVTNFDVILFNVIDITGYMGVPKARSDNQMYVFVSTESAENYPQLAERFNYFFNYTWTYKFNSDITYPYFIVRNKLRRKIIGPGKRVHWMNTTKMRPVDEGIKNRLQNKTVAAAWFVTNCMVSSRLDYAHALNYELNKYNLSIDIYGACGNKVCPRADIDTCLKILESDYYFYLAFENSFCEDYVTEKLLNALEHYTVPVVRGGANYSRFMPDGIYLNAENYKEDELAKLINDAIQNKSKYYDYFKWHRYYSYHAAHESSETDPLCAFCAFLNDNTNRNQRRAYTNFVQWWNENLHAPNDTQNYIEHYGYSDPNIKSFYTYSDPSVKEYETKTPTVLEEVGDLVNNVINYYFE